MIDVTCTKIENLTEKFQRYNKLKKLQNTVQPSGKCHKQMSNNLPGVEWFTTYQWI